MLSTKKDQENILLDDGEEEDFSSDEMARLKVELLLRVKSFPCILIILYLHLILEHVKI